jgi:ABC-2 type transport system permease protein
MMKKYIGVFKNYFSSAIIYRSNLISLLLMEIIKTGVVIVIWFSVFQSKDSLGGYTLGDSILYYLLVPLIGFITQVDLSIKLGEEIREGYFSNYLLKPYSFSIFSFFRVLGDKLNSLLIIVPLYFSIFLLLSKVFALSVFSVKSILLLIVLLGGGLMMSFLMDYAISLAVFWMDDIWSFEHFKRIAVGIMGGLSFPFEFLPDLLQQIFHLLPFKFFYYIPISYFLGKRTIDSLVGDLIMLICWFLFFLLITKLFWIKGLKRYEAFGY